MQYAHAPEQVLPLCEALVAGGVIALEITLTTPNAVACIRAVKTQLGDRALVGVGSVLDYNNCRAALDAGAEFVVSPISRLELIGAAHAADRAVMLGAYSPTEAQLVHEAGADMVKIFPADGLGPGYFKALRAPMPLLQLVPTGGVNLKTAADFIRAGCVALGLGGSLVSDKILRAADWPEMTRLGREYVEIVRATRQEMAAPKTV